MTAEHFNHMEVIRVRDRDKDWGVQFAVIGWNEWVLHDGMYEQYGFKVLFTTETCDYDGGYQQCEAWIEGYCMALPRPSTPATFVTSCGIPIEPFSAPHADDVKLFAAEEADANLDDEIPF